MRKRTRTILFFICLILFILVTPAVILYSEGYRLDFNPPKGTIRITQTGGLFVKVFQKSAEIYLNGKMEKETSIFTNSALIRNLLPKKYRIEIKKENYHPWGKELQIEEKKVTEVKNKILFPKDPQLENLIENVNDFWFSPDEKKIITYEPIYTGSPNAQTSQSWALKIYDLENNIKSYLIGEKDIYQRGAQFFSLEFSPDSKEIYLNLGMKEQEKVFELSLDEYPLSLKEKMQTEIPDNVAFETFEQDIYYLDSLGNLFKSDPSLEHIVKLNQKPFPVKQETPYQLKIFPNCIFLRENKKLFMLDKETKSFKEIFSPSINVKISPDLKKVVYFSKSEIKVLFLDQILEQPERTAGEEILITRMSEKINDVFWINSDYLVFTTDQNIKITEIDNRDKINIINFLPSENANLKELKSPKIFWSQRNKKLYVLNESNFYSSKELFK